MKVLILLVLTLHVAFSARILCIFNMFAYSHHLLGHRLLEELANRGHEVIMVSPTKNEKPIKNYRNVQLIGMKEAFEAKINKGGKKFDAMAFANTSPFLMNFLMHDMGLYSVEYTFNQTNFQNFLKENQKIDLVIMEQFFNDGFKGLCHHFNAPCMLMSTIGASELNNYIFGNGAPSSYIPSIFYGFQSDMTFTERIVNTVYNIYQRLLFDFMFMEKQNELMHKYLPNTPHIKELLYNHNSIILLNSHPSATQPVPLTPNMIEIGGFHVKPAKKLPENFQKYMDSAKDGVILFSLGSHIQSSDLPPEKIKSILTVLGKLKQKVIWKFEKEDLPGKPNNVLISKWVPQQDVLGHPNLKLFITHGGLLSTIEAVYNGVPMVGIPCGADQKYNVANNAKNKIAVEVKLNNLSEETLSEAINKVLSDPTYRNNVKHRQKLMHDQPLKPLDTAVYWTEYMIRHKGAAHLRSEALNLNWFIYASLDVILFLTFVVFLAAVIPIKLICYIARKFKCKNEKSKKSKLKKN